MVVIVAVVMTLYAVLAAAYDRGGWAGEAAGARRRRQAWFRCVVVGVDRALLRRCRCWRCSSSPPAAPGGGRSLDTWATLLDVGAVERDYPELQTGLIASAGLAVLTVAIMLAAAGARR